MLVFFIVRQKRLGQIAGVIHGLILSSGQDVLHELHVLVIQQFGHMAGKRGKVGVGGIQRLQELRLDQVQLLQIERICIHLSIVASNAGIHLKDAGLQPLQLFLFVILFHYEFVQIRLR